MQKKKWFHFCKCGRMPEKYKHKQTSTISMLMHNMDDHHRNSIVIIFLIITQVEYHLGFVSLIPGNTTGAEAFCSAFEAGKGKPDGLILTGSPAAFVIADNTM